MTFNYLTDAPPEFIERLRDLRVPPELRTPLAALVTAFVVVFAWWGLERHWIAQALREEAVAAARLEQSRAAFAATKLVRSNLEELLALDARLREIRLSGSLLSGRLTDIGNHVPSRAWLTSISRSAQGLDLEGRAEGLNVLGKTVAALMSSKGGSSPTLVRAVREDRSKGGLVSFTVHLADGSR